MRIQLFKMSFSVCKWYLEDEQGVFGEGLCLPVKSSTSNLANMVEDKTLSQRTILKVWRNDSYKPWTADVAEDEGPAPHNGRRAVNSLIMLLVPGAGHAHRVEEHVSVKLNLGETFSWQVDTIRHLFAHP